MNWEAMERKRRTTVKKAGSFALLRKRSEENRGTREAERTAVDAAGDGDLGRSRQWHAVSRAFEEHGRDQARSQHGLEDEDDAEESRAERDGRGEVVVDDDPSPNPGCVCSAVGALSSPEEQEKAHDGESSDRAAQDNGEAQVVESVPRPAPYAPCVVIHRCGDAGDLGGPRLKKGFDGLGGIDGVTGGPGLGLGFLRAFSLSWYSVSAPRAWQRRDLGAYLLL